MSLTLSLLRHADAIDHHPSGDFYRPLSAHGISQCKHLAHKLTDKQISLPYCISSPAVRTLTTTMTVLHHMWYDHQSIQCESVVYDGNLDDHIMYIRHLKLDTNHILRVWHNGEISQLTSRLVGETLSLHKSEYISVEIDVAWRDQISRWSAHIIHHFLPSKDHTHDQHP